MLGYFPYDKYFADALISKYTVSTTVTLLTYTVRCWKKKKRKCSRMNIYTVLKKRTEKKLTLF